VELKQYTWGFVCGLINEEVFFFLYFEKSIFGVDDLGRIGALELEFKVLNMNYFDSFGD
jgi:hypothetical protein